jgi:phosphatidylserine/phosphatidylglycerophosphate/cardiolipin synthase-like enzyme
VQAYSFTSAPIAKVLVEAHRRGVEVKVILEQKCEYAPLLLGHFSGAHGRAGVDRRRARHRANKVMVIDEATVITGSFNFTKAAEEHNAENLLIIHDPVLAARYTENWHKHLEHWPPYQEGAAQSESRSSSNGENRAEAGEAASESSSATVVIVGNRRSHIYAWPGCRTYTRMAPANRVVFPSAQAAERAGYHAARDCP